MRAADIAGQRFGRLVALRPVKVKGIRRRWECVCDCGNRTMVAAAYLNCGNTASCGCYYREAIFARWGSHGATKHPLFSTWRGMLTRCYNTKTPGFERYGARGIRVCDRWLNDPFAFFADMGPKPSADHSIDRIDSDGHYEPSNCRWATDVEQNRNRSTCRKVTWNGRTMSLPEWAITTGINRRRLGARLRNGWTVERALSQPLRRSPRQ